MTVLQYLEQIPDQEIRDKAIKNLFKECGTEWTTSLPAALKRAFLWHRSAEGFQYWDLVHKKLSAGKSQSL